METLDAIGARRSIRRFTDEPVSEADVRALLEVAILAPSGKNAQPWRFVVVEGDQRAGMIAAMRKGIDKAKADGAPPGSSEWTLKIMERAPVTIFAFADMEMPESLTDGVPDVLWLMVNVQSIGAAIQNLLLAATARGLGTLWICDVYYAIDELCAWLGESRVLVAAISVGHPDESPSPRPRKGVDEVARWHKG